MKGYRWVTYHLIVHTITTHLKKETNKRLCYTAQELCKSRGGHPGLPVPNSPHGLCGRKAALNLNYRVRAQELCESRGGRPGLPVPNSPYGLWTLSNIRRRSDCENPNISAVRMSAVILCDSQCRDYAPTTW